ncbi:hypothetical protein [Microbacterium sp. 1P10AE]|uniref:hypothetical protein n=1 Tax=Microbacterium sp. 1P10AE TaxID=3132286 RepID=UPI0039A33F9E
MSNVVDIVIELFTWVGLGAGILLAIAALILYVADGTWVPVRAVVEDVDDHRVVRWFDEHGGVNEAPLSPHDDARIGAADMADVYARRGSRHRMRLTPSSPLVRFVGLLAIGVLSLGALAFALSVVLLFARG